MLLIGDFHHILPAERSGGRSHIVGSCLKRSRLYPVFKTLHLYENMRLVTLQRYETAEQAVLQFPSFLSIMAEGKPQETSPEPITISRTIQMVETVEDLIGIVFSDVRNEYRDEVWLSQRAIFKTRNVKLEMLDKCVGQLIPSESRVDLSADSIDNREEYKLGYPVECFNRIPGTASFSDHRLYLKKGYVVMLLRNIQPNKGHVKGAKYIVESMTDNVLFMHVATGDHKRNRITLPRVPCNPGDDDCPVEDF